MDWKRAFAKTVGVERFKVELHHKPSDGYSPGDTIRGNVVITNSTQIEFHGIYVRIKGSASVGWFEASRATRRHGQEVYFNEIIPLLQNRGVSIVQSPGEHRFPLNFILPQRIPSSYKNSVRYSIKAVMDRPPRKFDCVSKIPFFVSTVADLNDEDAAEYPVQAEFSGNKNNQSQFIKAKVWLDKAGYVPGEKVYFNAKIENCRNKSIRKSYVQLIKCTTFTADNNNKHKKEKIIFHGEKGKIRKNETFFWSKYAIPIPRLPPSKFEYCQLIDVSYVIKLFIDPGFMDSNVSIPIRILIGNVRLRKNTPTIVDRLVTPIQSVSNKIR